MSSRLRLVIAAPVIFGLAACAGSSSKGTTASTHPSTTATKPSGATATSTKGAGGTCPTSTTGAGGSGKESSPPGDIPDTVRYTSETGPSLDYSVKVPEGWARTEQGTAVILTDKFNSVRLDEVASATAPTVDSARTTEVPTIQQSTQCFKLTSVAAVTRKVGPMIAIVYTADSPPDPVTGKVVTDDVERYEVWRGGKEAIVTLSGSHGSDNVDPWRTVTDSFQWK